MTTATYTVIYNVTGNDGNGTYTTKAASKKQAFNKFQTYMGNLVASGVFYPSKIALPNVPDQNGEAIFSIKIVSIKSEEEMA